jgi:hypothetical protein
MIDLVKRIRFDPGDESSVLTSVSDQCSKGKCDSCPGTFQRDDNPGESIFCIHDCHKKQKCSKGTGPVNTIRTIRRAALVGAVTCREPVNTATTFSGASDTRNQDH